MKLYIPAGSARYWRTERSKQCDAFKAKVLIPASRLKISYADHERLNALLGLEGFLASMPLSDMAARTKSLRIFSKCVGEFFRRNLTDETLVCFGTFADDLGLTTDLEAIFRLKRFGQKVGRIIRKHGFNAIIVMEVQPVTNHSPNGRGQALLLHAHAAMWKVGLSKEALEDVRIAMNASPTWTNHFNADVVDLIPIDGGVGEIEKVASYMMKLPFVATWLKMVRPGEFRFRQTKIGYRHRTALRIMEGLSHYSIYDAVFSVGDGKLIRKQWKFKLQRWQRYRIRKSLPLPAFEVPDFWQRVRADNNHGGRYFPFLIE